MDDKPDCLIIEPHKPDLKEKLFFFISGIIVSVPLTLFFGTFTTTLTSVLPFFYAQILSVVIFAPIIEEFAKAYPLFYRHGETEKSIVKLGFLVGLGFGIAEFFVYVFGLGVPFYIRLPGILFHASSTAIVAYGIAKKRPFFFYLIAVGLHLLINFTAIFDRYLLAYIALNSGTYILAWILYSKTRDNFVNGTECKYHT
ncbi:hypothetical protein JCM15415_16730 [Methanobacterium movens]